MRLTATGLVCVRGGREVFSGLDLAVCGGEALAITGRNGAGKSSLLRLLAGLIPRAGGSLELSGGDGELTLPEQAHYLGHHDALKPALSVIENLLFWHDFLGGDGADPQQALAAVEIDHIAGLPAGYLSAGQRRRLSIARLLTVRRPVWLLDEPTSALDTAAQATLAGLMTGHLAAGGLILAATHGPLGLAAPRRLHIGPPLAISTEPA
ncbi:MAG: heme ABC exporter ATP-binding protein CcmA [Xanthobacteraceae bacterium]|nr:MAG: heme ABC exporter ATP-binding protein CcmA [Xanthobacteraceae bacterium]